MLGRLRRHPTGLCQRPFHGDPEVTKEVGAKEWIAMLRFPVVLNSSVRPVDDTSRSGLRANLFATTCDELEVTSIDDIVSDTASLIDSQTRRRRATSRKPSSRSWWAAGFWMRAKLFDKCLHTYSIVSWWW